MRSRARACVRLNFASGDSDGDEPRPANPPLSGAEEWQFRAETEDGLILGSNPSRRPTRTW